MQKNGYLDGSKMATAFNMLRASDLIWPYVVNNYLKGKDPMPFDLLYWNSDATRMPAANHSYYLRNCYLENNLSQGKMELAGKTLETWGHQDPDLQSGRKGRSHRPCPLRLYRRQAVWRRCHLCHGRIRSHRRRRQSAGSWQVPVLVGRPAECRVRRLGSRRPGNAGSWWPHWHNWIREGSDEEVPARKPGGKKLKPLEDAPGSYVRVRV
jgi:polyhydroxyalkanoate synthase